MAAELPAFWDAPISFWEYAMKEPLPVGVVQAAVLENLRGRQDVALDGALAVNAYVRQHRGTKDVNILALRAANLAEEIGDFLADRFSTTCAVRPRRDGKGCRVVQVREPHNRRLVDIASVTSLPPTEQVEGVFVVSPAELIARKTAACQRSRGKAREGLERRDLLALLLAFPELKSDPGPVATRLEAAGADEAVLAIWAELAAQEVLPEDDDSEFD